MKRAILINIAIAVMLLSTFTNISCKDQTENIKSLKESKVLIAYFSCNEDNTINGQVTSATPKADNTKKLAEMIREEIGGNLFPIITSKKYDSDYGPVVEIAKIEKKEKARPELIGKVNNFDTYDVIVVAFPNWWHTMPMPVFTFLESYDFSGKTIIPVCTHGGGGIQEGDDDIKKSCPDAIVTKSLVVSGYRIDKAQKLITEFFKKINK